MALETQLTTAEQLLALPSAAGRRELVRGEIHEMAPSSSEHGRIAMRFSWPLAQFVETHQLGVVFAAETGFQLARDPDTVRAADVAYVGTARLEAAGATQGFFPGAPDLAVEVISPSDRYTDVEQKVAEWLDAGARTVVIVNPRNRTIKVHRPGQAVEVLAEHEVFDGGEIVAGFQLAVRRLFE